MAQLHKQTGVMYCGHRIQVDKGIAPLLKALWRCGVDTLMSCENNVPDGFVWIEFGDAEYFERFIKILWFNGISEEIKGCMNGLSNFYHDTYEPDDWIFHLCVEEEFDMFSYSVRFPKQHYDELLRVFEGYGEEQ